MNVCFVVKYPPIEGGVSMRCYWIARSLARRGHTIVAVTNAPEVEPEYRIRLTSDDAAWYEPSFPDTGGAVIVKSTTAPSERTRYIPYANPYVTKLATIAQRSIAEHQCTSIFAYYLEPYGIAAYLASQWTDTPYVVRHAGSDLGRLMKDPDLHGAYREVLRRARYVSSALREPLTAMGVDPERIWASRPIPIPDIFSPDAAPIDLRALASETAAHGDATFDASRPTFGIYGKVGPNKGSLDLVLALGALKKRGLPFNLVAITQGRAIDAFVQLVRDQDLEDRTTILPFVPHWRVPGFIRACTAVCFLERHFPIAFHSPTVPREVLACGTCLVISSEIVAKQAFASDVRHGEHLFSVDPTDRAALASHLETIVRDPVRAAAVGAAGHEMYARHVSPSAWTALVDDWERHLALASDGPRAPTARRHWTAQAPSRVEALASCLPLTRTALGDRWPDLVRDYCGPARALAADYQDAMQCVGFLRSADLADAPRWIDDLLRYEWAHNRMYALSGIDNTGGEKYESTTTLTAADAAFFSLVPRVRRGVHIETFAYDMTALCAALHRNDLATPVPAKRTTILFKSEANFVGQELVVTETVKRLIEACDGTRTVQDLADAFFVESDGRTASDAPAVAREVARTIKQLAVKGIVGFVPLAPPLYAGAGTFQEARS
jgi:glycosyltransferase involved in cell wall biosynthesis